METNMNFKVAQKFNLEPIYLKEYITDELSDDGAERLILASNSINVNNLINLDSDEDLQKFLDETD